jgi:hypothetical protein
MTPTDSSTHPSRLLHMAASDATQLALRDWPLAPGVKPRAQVLLVHGLGEHSGRYAALAQRLNDSALRCGPMTSTATACRAGRRAA